MNNMKKNLSLIAGAACAVAVLFSSCESAPSTKVELKNEVDSISYSFGASMGENIEETLKQIGVVSDTLMISMQYSSKIANEQDADKKKSLEKELRHKIDSTKKANDYNTLNFLQGFKEALNASESKNSYNVGVSFGSQVAQQVVPNIKAQFIEEGSNLEVNKKAIIAALSASIQKQNLLFPHASSYIMMKSQEKQQEEMNRRKLDGDKNKAEGEKFLEENKTKEGVVALESGVQYKILKEGNGAKPKASDTVVCHYEGSLLDGTVFDSSLERGEPASFPLQGVIAGWTEVLQLMPVGSKWEVYIPYDKAYGPNGSGQAIPPFAALKFQIELLEIK